MIVVCFDPVAGRVFAHGEGEPPFLDVPACGLTAKFYAEAGILYLELRGQSATLRWFDVNGLPGRLRLEPAGPGWAVLADG